MITSRKLVKHLKICRRQTRRHPSRRFRLSGFHSLQKLIFYSRSQMSLIISTVINHEHISFLSLIHTVAHEHAVPLLLISSLPEAGQIGLKVILWRCFHGRRWLAWRGSRNARRAYVTATLRKKESRLFIFHSFHFLRDN